MNLTLVIFGILMFLFVTTHNFIWALLGITAILLLKGIIIVPKMHLGAVYFLGWYTGLTYTEGLKPIIPFLTEVRAYPAKPQRLDIKVEVETDEGDGSSLNITIDGNTEFYADKSLMWRYRMETDDTIKNGIVSAIKQELNVIAGKIKGFDFISFKEEIALIINCMLRLRDLPHRCATGPDFNEAEDYIQAENRLAFYKKHRPKIIWLLNHEAERRNERSAIEERYGIDIRIFNLSDISFTQEMKKAFEKKREAEATMKGAEILAKRQEEIARKWQESELGLSPEAASNKADVVTGKAVKQIMAFEGPIVDLAKAVFAFLGANKESGKTKKSDSIFLGRRD